MRTQAAVWGSLRARLEAVAGAAGDRIDELVALVARHPNPAAQPPALVAALEAALTGPPRPAPATVEYSPVEFEAYDPTDEERARVAERLAIMRANGLRVPDLPACETVDAGEVGS